MSKWLRCVRFQLHVENSHLPGAIVVNAQSLYVAAIPDILPKHQAQGTKYVCGDFLIEPKHCTWTMTVSFLHVLKQTSSESLEVRC